MFSLAKDVSYVDLNFRNMPGVIATGVLMDSSGITLVDPGPTSCLSTLRRELAAQGMAIADVRSLLLTHIHLDHAGAAGTLVQENPAIDVYVHERGAKHMVDPSKLLESATRLFGTMMGPWWGAVLPVPSERVKVLYGGETIRIAGRQLEVAYTPGHASHHVSYFDRSNGLAWVGDTAGIRVGQSTLAIPSTPPPDIDLELWDESLASIRKWQPATVFLTHFGPADAVSELLDDFAMRLHDTAEMVRRILASERSEDDYMAAYAEEFSQYRRRLMSEHDALLSEHAAPLSYNWYGLARYWRRRTTNLTER